MAKLRRADEHRQALDTLFGDFLDADPYAVSFEFEPETGWHRFRWNVSGPEPPVEDLALIFGDFLANLHATLDYLVWQLVLAAGNEPTVRNEFPICMRSDQWASTRPDRLKGVDDQWADRIEQMQPYQRPDRPEIHPLAILSHVNNINKHRVLPAVVLGGAIWTPTIKVESMEAGEQLHFDSFLSDPIEHDAEFFRFRCDSRQQLDVHVDEPPTFRVSFRDGLDHNWYNIEIFNCVRYVVSLFEPAFSR